MTSVDEFPNTNPCCKWDAQNIDAYFDLQLTPADSTILTLDNSWGPTSVDLEPAIKAGETITHLLLTDSALQYNREDYGRTGVENGGVDCISGDKLSKIISMQYLKDVGGNNPTNGDVYMYNSSFNNFQPYNLQAFVNQTNGAISNLNGQIQQLELGLTSVNNRIDGAINDYTNKIESVQGDITNLQSQVSGLRTDLTALQTTVSNLQSDYNAYKTATNNRFSAIEATIAKPSWAPANATLAWGNTNTAMDGAKTTNGIWTHNPNNNVLGDTLFK